MFDFSGKVVLVTGAAGNLGLAVAQGFHDAGAKLVVVDLSVERLRQAYAAWESAGRALLLAVDLTREKSVEEMARQAESTYGRVDVLANVAGGFLMGPRLHETPVNDWEFMIRLNAESVFLSSRAILPMMLASGSGKIVSVAARAGREGKAKMGPYCASKAAVITLTESMAAEYKTDHINVNCILPGTIDTPQNREAMPDADYSKWVKPRDLANVVLFLASDAAVALHGASIPVYGQS